MAYLDLYRFDFCKSITKLAIAASNKKYMEVIVFANYHSSDVVIAKLQFLFWWITIAWAATAICKCHCSLWGADRTRWHLFLFLPVDCTVELARLWFGSSMTVLSPVDWVSFSVKFPLTHLHMSTASPQLWQYKKLISSTKKYPGPMKTVLVLISALIHCGFSLFQQQRLDALEPIIHHCGTFLVYYDNFSKIIGAFNARRLVFSLSTSTN